MNIRKRILQRNIGLIVLPITKISYSILKKRTLNNVLYPIGINVLYPIPTNHHTNKSPYQQITIGTKTLYPIGTKTLYPIGTNVLYPIPTNHHRNKNPISHRNKCSLSHTIHIWNTIIQFLFNIFCITSSRTYYTKY
jgi:hypothetical protein